MIQIHPITGQITFAYSMTLSDTAYILGKHASIATTSPDALYQNAGVSNNLVVIKGQVHGGMADFDSAITLTGGSTVVKVAESGIVDASTGVQMGGAGQLLENHGTIDASDRGVWLQSDGTVRNYGRIHGEMEGIFSGGVNSVKVVNGESGRIISESAAIQFDGGPDTASILRNDGLINGKGDNWALYSASGAETVINHGVMKGRIWMGEGNDTFDNRGGKVDHEIRGGLGNDTLITDSAKVQLMELVDQGSDTVKSTVTYTLFENVENLVLLGKADINGKGTETDNALGGNKGDNRLTGLGGEDILNGARGNDIMTGGADADVFLFTKGGGHDVITDFVGGEDHVDLSGQQIIIDYDDLIKSHITSSHGDLVIHMGNDTLTLRDTVLADLDDKDFFF
ncbi:hypothetical protein IHQ71_13055 [Rhizobium sp. TH2]|uniref:calcium-binding protein n=1 Tax=Rhizobium sp. TH2 TaxID=2775403 RepID=UPI002157119A|nr:calcium-binding protein [Rhizobium sp. TH2]UVC11416.1 hypothetical protein IHQ71_13055 [Rhizobium sp. TH2]